MGKVFSENRFGPMLTRQTNVFLHTYLYFPTCYIQIQIKYAKRITSFNSSAVARGLKTGPQKPLLAPSTKCQDNTTVNIKLYQLILLEKLIQTFGIVTLVANYNG